VGCLLIVSCGTVVTMSDRVKMWEVRNVTIGIVIYFLKLFLKFSNFILIII
jgi:hypothetical protein